MRSASVSQSSVKSWICHSPSEDLISSDSASMLYVLLKSNTSQCPRGYQRNNRVTRLRHLLGGGQGTKHMFWLITCVHNFVLQSAGVTCMIPMLSWHTSSCVLCCWKTCRCKHIISAEQLRVAFFSRKAWLTYPYRDDNSRNGCWDTVFSCINSISPHPKNGEREYTSQ